MCTIELDIISTEQIAVGQMSLRAVRGTVHFADTACAMSVCGFSGPSEEEKAKTQAMNFNKYHELAQ